MRSGSWFDHALSWDERHPRVTRVLVWVLAAATLYEIWSYVR